MAPREQSLDGRGPSTARCLNPGREAAQGREHRRPGTCAGLGVAPMCPHSGIIGESARAAVHAVSDAHSSEATHCRALEPRCWVGQLALCVLFCQASSVMAKGASFPEGLLAQALPASSDGV